MEDSSSLNYTPHGKRLALLYNIRSTVSLYISYYCSTYGNEILMLYQMCHHRVLLRMGDLYEETGFLHIVCTLT